MLDKIVTCLKGFCYASVSVAAICLALLLYKAQPVVKGLQNDVDETHRVLLEAGLTAREARMASAEERAFLNKTLPVMSKQVSQVLDKTSVALTGINQDTTALNRVIVQIGDNTTMLSLDAHQTLTDLQDTLLNIAPIEEQLSHTVRDTDLLITSPEVKDSLVNIDKSSQSIAKATDHTEKAAADIQQQIHAFTHPKILTRVVNYTLDVARFIKF